MTKTFSWKTTRGADVEMNVTVEHVKTETINADGHKMEVACSKWIRKINSMKVNGKETNQKEFWTEQQVECVLIDYVGKDRLLVALPADVLDFLYGAEKKEIRDRETKVAASEKAYEEHRKMMKEVMGY